MCEDVMKCPEGAKDIFVNHDSFKIISEVKSDLVYNDCDVKNPVISIMVPTFNSNLVNDAIKSAVAQKESPDYEIIVVDNHSDEDRFNNLLEFVKSIKSRHIKLYRNNQNIGMYGNWNRCLELSRASYVTYLHSDDLLKDTCLKDLWECHLKIEKDAAIIGIEELTYTNGVMVRRDKIPHNHLWGLIKGREKYKRRRIDLLTPGGNGCGHLFYRDTLIGIGGYSKSGDCGAMLRYQLQCPVYDFYKITRVKRVGENESVTVAKDFALYGYHVKLQVIDKYFNNSRWLQYISRLEYESSSFPLYNVMPIRNLRFYEKMILKAWRGSLYIFRRYSIV